MVVVPAAAAVVAAVPSRTPHTAICEGLAMMLRLARNLVARVGGQGPTAVAEAVAVRIIATARPPYYRSSNTVDRTQSHARCITLH